MMNLRPTDLPELRDRMLAVLDHPEYRRGIEQDFAGIKDYAHLGLAGDIDAAIRLERSILEHADLYFAAGEMVDLASAAAETLPDFLVEPEDLPSERGLIAFQRPLGPVLHGEPPLDYLVDAYMWVSYGSAVCVQPYTDRDRMLAALVAAGICKRQDAEYSAQQMAPLVPLGGRWTLIPFYATGTNDESLTMVHLARALRSAWLLMSQPVTSVTNAEYDRATRRRLQRQEKEPPPVRVITLRRQSNPTGSGQSDREYHHQWIVRGHWRQQWYPAREVHRPVWIAPHIKGPEGAPMLGGEKVYAWTR